MPSARVCSAACVRRVVRLYDEVATRLTLSPVVGSNLPGVSTVLCFEGTAAVVDAERDRCSMSSAPAEARSWMEV